MGIRLFLSPDNVTREIERGSTYQNNLQRFQRELIAADQNIRFREYSDPLKIDTLREQLAMTSEQVRQARVQSDVAEGTRDLLVQATNEQNRARADFTYPASEAVTNKVVNEAEYTINKTPLKEAQDEIEMLRFFSEIQGQIASYSAVLSNPIATEAERANAKAQLARLRTYASSVQQRLEGLVDVTGR